MSQVVFPRLGAVPDVHAVRRWIDVSRDSIDDDDLAQVINGELELQAIACRVPADPGDYPPFLAQALYRRVARVCASRGVPLGLAGLDTEFGGTRLPNIDAEIERLEGPVRKVVFG